MVDKMKLIELVREREALWNQRDNQYHNRELRAKLWDDVGKELGIEGDVARKSWDLLRDVYRKKIKENVGALGAATKSKWFYFDALSFLFPMMKLRATPGNLSVSEVATTLDLDEESGQTPQSENDFDVHTEQPENADEPEEPAQVSEAHQSTTTSWTSTTNPENK
ncbi:uncharacterized protein LOC128983186 isoform X2 [Macrosteles quadrilineatus]|uniref:uncharacterized protein LOC128983186 isoform X2 n=1 Tax=Macrosteles quadrilineatus TaxID=74068 RepID=UPI0023E28C52|nr:uncharacterized protein LOC128983186 isoform X2 [Macrosteles quadrilineatus]